MLQKLATNFRIKLDDDQLEIFLDRLAGFSDYQISTAFELAMKECLFFPNMRELLDRMPEDSPPRTFPMCDNCRPDGWRTVIIDGSIKAIRCNHDPNNPPNATWRDLPNPWADDQLPEWALREKMKARGEKLEPRAGDRAPDVSNPRWPHLIGKGIIYGDGK